MIGDLTESEFDNESEDEQNNLLIYDRHTLTTTEQMRFTLAQKSRNALSKQIKDSI